MGISSSIYDLSKTCDLRMSKILLHLRDRVVTDTGEVVAKYILLEKQLQDGKPLGAMRALYDIEIIQRNRQVVQSPIQIYEETDHEGPSENSFKWSIPKEYQDLDIVDYCATIVCKLDLGPDDFPRYIDRLDQELREMERRDMFPFIQALIYVLDQFRQKDVVWGVGRGSACASLVLYLIGIHKVDPIKYDIPLEEFLRPGKEK